MRKKLFLLVCSVVVCSCSSHHAGRVIETQDVASSSGTVPYRTGTVPYRNQGSDAKDRCSKRQGPPSDRNLLRFGRLHDYPGRAVR